MGCYYDIGKIWLKSNKMIMSGSFLDHFSKEHFKVNFMDHRGPIEQLLSTIAAANTVIISM